MFGWLKRLSTNCREDDLKPFLSFPKSSVEIALARQYEGLLPPRKEDLWHIMKKRLCGRPRVKLCGWLEMKRNNEIITKKKIFASGILEKELCLE